MPNSATSVERNTNLRIQYQCPQCGAPAVLEETDRLFVCGFCRVKSYLLQHGCFRYVLPHAADSGQDLLYLPYWRFKGMQFSCLAQGVRHQFVDYSHQAVASDYFPASLGLRSQALTLKFATPDLNGYYLKAVTPFSEVMRIFQRRINRSLPKPLLHQCHIGDTLSLIYAPFYVKHKVFDAVLNQPVTPELPEDFTTEIYAGGKSDWQIRLLPTLCPDCGWDLEGQRDSLVLICRNCRSIWTPAHDKLIKLKFGCIPAKARNVSFLPFWRLKAEIGGVVLHSYADLVRLANLPKVVQSSWRDRVPCFWVPAFKVRPGVFLRLAQNATLAQPEQAPAANLPDQTLYPVTLPVKEAAESIKVLLAALIRPRETLPTVLPDLSVKAQIFSLIYIPFEEKQMELINSKYNLTINRNLLRLSQNL